MGGWYSKLQPVNWTDGSDNTRYEINHVPAKATHLSLGMPTDLKESTGPSIGITGFPLGLPAEAVRTAAEQLGRLRVSD